MNNQLQKILHSLKNRIKKIKIKIQVVAAAAAVVVVVVAVENRLVQKNQPKERAARILKGKKVVMVKIPKTLALCKLLQRWV